MPIIILAPNGRWSARQQTGVAAVNGFVFTYHNLTRTPKATYRDPAGIVPNTNPIRLDSKGEANIYWDITDTFYTIEVYAANPTSPFIPGELLYSQDNYPFVDGAGGGDIIVQYLAGNLIRNAQFTFWGGKTYLLPSASTPEDVWTRLGTNEVICDDWIFERNNTNANIQISRGHFFPGQTDVPASPINYLHYQADTTGSGETFKAVSQIYQSAQTFSGLEVSIGLWAKSSITSVINIYITQNFGTGGSPSASVITPIISPALTTDWTQYTGTVVIPSVAGKTFGTNGDDYIKFSVGFPLNAIAAADLANVQFHGQNTLPDFPYNTVNDQYKHLDAVVNEGTSITGDYLLSLQEVPRAGWILCDDETIGNDYSNATHTGNQYLQLYMLIWNTVSNAHAPIYDEDGVLDERGASAFDDWDDDKQLNLTRVLGRVFGAVGQPTFFQEFVEEEIAPKTFTSVLTFSSVLSVTSGSVSGVSTGNITTFAGGSLPAPLVAGTSYYFIPVNSATFKVASTFANANAGINITITGAGSGTFGFPVPGNGTFVAEQTYVLTTASTADLLTGQAVELTTTGALPTPLLTATVYYVINESPTTFQLAATLANAEAGTKINVTSAGTGVHSLNDNDLIIMEDALSFYTGTPVVLSTDGALPLPLLPGVTYYAIYVNSTSISLATTYSNAIAGISIPFTTAGNGTQVATITYTDTLTAQSGQVLGEFTHGMTKTEAPLATTVSGSTTTSTNFLVATGSSTPFNVVEPSFYTNCFLKL